MTSMKIFCDVTGTFNKRRFAVSLRNEKKRNREVNNKPEVGTGWKYFKRLKFDGSAESSFGSQARVLLENVSCNERTTKKEARQRGRCSKKRGGGGWLPRSKSRQTGFVASGGHPRSPPFGQTSPLAHLPLFLFVSSSGPTFALCLASHHRELTCKDVVPGPASSTFLLKSSSDHYSFFIFQKTKYLQQFYFQHFILQICIHFDFNS